MIERHPSANACQRARRARHPRIDYYPSGKALAVVKAKMGPYAPTNTYSGVLDAIVMEWADLNGMTPVRPAGITRHQCAGAYDFGGESWIAANRAKQTSRRVVCGARRHRDGEPCQAKSEPGKRRCRYHGGRSTGPRTPEGKVRAMENLKQYARRRYAGVATAKGEA